MVPIDLERLCRRLNYRFKNIELLKQALTHRSANINNNERFEFVGDSIVNFVIAHALFHRFPQASEGELSRLRAYLVKGERLAEVAAEIKLGDYLYLGQGELKTGGFRRASILADTLEAIFAAIVFDGGFEITQSIILALFDSRLNDPQLRNCLKDAKTLLQEYLQSHKLALPKYTLSKVEGDEHDQIFFINCEVQGITRITTGHAENRRKAEQIAAKLFLEGLLKD